MSALLVVTILGTMAFGLVIWQHNVVTDLAREGARWASVRGASSGKQAATAAQVQSFVQSLAPGTLLTVTTTSADPATRGCTTTGVDPSSLGPGTDVCVTVERRFTTLTRLMPYGAVTLEGTAQRVMD